eukprot:jgi/Botrbrau1/23200/Bobra.0041s0044.1
MFVRAGSRLFLFDSLRAGCVRDCSMSESRSICSRRSQMATRKPCMLPCVLATVLVVRRL